MTHFTSFSNDVKMKKSIDEFLNSVLSFLFTIGDDEKILDLIQKTMEIEWDNSDASMFIKQKMIWVRIFSFTIRQPELDLSSYGMKVLFGTIYDLVEMANIQESTEAVASIHMKNILFDVLFFNFYLISQSLLMIASLNY